MVLLNKSEDPSLSLLHCLWYDITIVWYMHRFKEVHLSTRIVFSEGFKICHLREVWIWMKRNMKLKENVRKLTEPYAPKNNCLM